MSCFIFSVHSFLSSSLPSLFPSFLPSLVKIKEGFINNWLPDIENGINLKLPLRRQPLGVSYYCRTKQGNSSFYQVQRVCQVQRMAKQLFAREFDLQLCGIRTLILFLVISLITDVIGLGSFMHYTLDQSITGTAYRSWKNSNIFLLYINFSVLYYGFRNLFAYDFFPD